MWSPALIALSGLLLGVANGQEHLLYYLDEAQWYVDPSRLEPANDADGCSITLLSSKRKDLQPLLIRPNTSEFYPFSDAGAVDVELDNTIELHCTSSLASPLSGKSVTATCAGGTTFLVDGIAIDISAIKCTAWPAFTGRKSGDSCNGGTTLIHVGFELEDSRFVKQYEVCYNEEEEATRYVYYTLDPGSNLDANGVDHIEFANADFFVKSGKDVDKLYNTADQKETFDKTLGIDSNKYIASARHMYLTRGQMAAHADFFYPAQQRATFMFINSAPQWQTFNGGNWARLEDSIRDWVSNNHRRVECWTGVWGVATLPNHEGQQTDLYLAYAPDGDGLIPVPKLYFRVIIEPSTKKGIVFVGVNNPHLTLEEIKHEYILCEDVSDQINWMNWKPTNILAGYSYACEVPDFTEKVTHLPEFSVKELLV